MEKEAELKEKVEVNELVNQDIKNCTKCNLKFSTDIELGNHIKFDHSSRIRICNKCDMNFPAMDMTEWLVVQRKHENTNCVLEFQKEVEHKKYKCEQCSFEPSTEAFLIEHKRNNHEGILKTPPNKRRKKITDDDMDTEENEDLVSKIEELVIDNKKELQKEAEKEEEKKRSQLRDEKIIQKQKIIEVEELKKKSEEETKRRKEVETSLR